MYIPRQHEEGLIARAAGDSQPAGKPSNTKTIVIIVSVLLYFMYMHMYITLDAA